MGPFGLKMKKTNIYCERELKTELKKVKKAEKKSRQKAKNIKEGKAVDDDNVTISEDNITLNLKDLYQFLS